MGQDVLQPLPAGGAAVDVTDRTTRLLGIVTIPAGVDVTDRIARLLGVVDTELPAAVGIGADGLAQPTTPIIGSALLGTNPAGTLDRIRTTGDDADAQIAIALGIPRALARGYMWNGTTWDRVRGTTALGMQVDTELPAAVALSSDAVANPTAPAVGAFPLMFDGNNGVWVRARGDTSGGQVVSMRRSTVVVAASPAANTGATLTLPAAGTGLFHFITHLYIARHATAALAGGATLTITSTNLGGLTWRTGNQASITAGTQENDPMLDTEYTHPIRSAVSNTASTIVLPAPGAAVLWTAWVAYYTGP